jgi:hypothetical protein
MLNMFLCLIKQRVMETFWGVEVKLHENYCLYIWMSVALSVLNKQQTPWPESASELYRPRDNRLSAKLVPNYADKGVSRGHRDGSLRP